MVDVMDYGRYDSRQVKDITEGLFRAVLVIHEAGYVHRDIKPENIFLSTISRDTSIAKLGDFGLARLISDAYVDDPQRSAASSSSPL